MVGLKQKEIDSLGKWYQSIDFGEYGKSKGNAVDLNKKWDLIKSYLPFSLKDKSILDLGCNAGYFMIQAAKKGAVRILGVEPHVDFHHQCIFTIETFSLIDNHSYWINMALSGMSARNLKLNIKYDITFAFNFFYWLTYSDEEGSIKNPEDELLKFLKKLSFHTQYLLVIGAEGVGKMREKTGKNDLGTSLARTLPFLEIYFTVLKKDIVRQNKKRHSNIILCKAKEH